MHGTYVRVTYAYMKQRVKSSGCFRGTVDNIMKLVHKTKTGTRMNVVHNLCFCRETKKSNALTLNRTMALTAPHLELTGVFQFRCQAVG
jgi:hypothetical protein